jgi:hypothetical protein
MEGGGSWCDSDFLLFLPGEGDFFLLLRAFSFAAFACGLHGAGRHMLDGDGFERDGCGCFVALSLCSEELYRDAARDAARESSLVYTPTIHKKRRRALRPLFSENLSSYVGFFL